MLSRTTATAVVVVVVMMIKYHSGIFGKSVLVEWGETAICGMVQDGPGAEPGGEIPEAVKTNM